MYFKFIKMQLRCALQYKASFFFVVLSQILSSTFYFAGMYLLFERFGSIAGWTLGEVALCYSIALMAFSLAECVARGFDTFSRFVVSGDFDRMLVRPRGTILQVMGSSFELTRIGRFAQATAVLIYSISLLGWHFDLLKVFMIASAILSGAVVFSGVFILGATFSFFTIEGLEFVNIFTDGGREISQYPLTIYKRWLTRFFTFVIPFGCMNYLPLMYLTGKTTGNDLLYLLSPLPGMLFIIPCILIWKYGVRKYLSTGS